MLQVWISRVLSVAVNPEGSLVSFDELIKKEVHAGLEARPLHYATNMTNGVRLMLRLTLSSNVFHTNLITKGSSSERWRTVKGDSSNEGALTTGVG